MSTNVGRRRTMSRRISPTAGPCRNPWPEKPVAYRKRETPAASPMIALWSGVISYSPAQPPRMPASAIRGARRRTTSIRPGIQSSVVSTLNPGVSAGSDMPISRPGPSRWK